MIKARAQWVEGSRSETVALLIVLVTALTGCELTKNMDEMHDSTVQMNQKMDQTNAGMTATNVTTAAMADQTNALYTDQRQGFSDQIRHQFLDAMERQPSMVAKLSEAGQYFMAFEFQLYKNFGIDTEARLDILYHQAAEEFFRTARRYINDDYDIDASSKNSRLLNAAALAVTMFRVNPNIAVNEELPSELKVSMLDLVERTLAKKSRLESGELREQDLKDYEREVFRNEQDAVYLLQLRTTFVGAIVLAGVTDIQNANLFTKLRRLFFKYDADFGKRLWNLEQIVTNAHYIADANRQRDFLISLGYEPRVDSKLLKLYRHMRIKAEPRPELAGTRAQQLQEEALQHLIDGINEYRN